MLREEARDDLAEQPVGLVPLLRPGDDAPDWQSQVRARPAAAWLAVFYAAYLLAAGLGQVTAIIPGITIMFWPPAGIFVVALLASPPSSWPWWILTGCAAELTANALWFGNPLGFALIYFAANATEATVCAWLLGRIGAKPLRLETLRDIVALIACAALASVLAATIGSVTDAIRGKHEFTTAWVHWWIGDTTGVLVSAPFALVAVRAWRERMTILGPQVIEAVLLSALLVVAAGLALKGYVPSLLIALPPLLWIAARFGIEGAAPGLVLLTVLTATFTAAGKGEFVGSPELVAQNVLMLQVFLAVAAFSAMIVAALASQHQRALRALRLANDDLEVRVAARTASLADSEQRLRTSEASYRTLLQLMPAAMCTCDATGRILLFNEQAVAIWGRVPKTDGSERFCGSLRLWLPDGTPVTDANMPIVDTLASGKRHREAEVLIERPDGERVPVICNIDPIRDADGRVVGAVNVFLDISERKRHEAHTHLLMSEVNHRAKNLLGLVQAIARQTAATNPKDFLERFTNRVQALSANQDLLVHNLWHGVDIDDLMRAQLSHFADLIGTRIAIVGPKLRLTAAAAQAIGLALHELATNAGKYGALSNNSGRVDINWRLDGPELRLSWAECGGPEVVPPERKGFGMTVVDTMARLSLSAAVDLEFAAAGLQWRLRCPAESALEGDWDAAMSARADENP